MDKIWSSRKKFKMSDKLFTLEQFCLNYASKFISVSLINLNVALEAVPRNQFALNNAWEELN